MLPLLHLGGLAWLYPERREAARRGGLPLPRRKLAAVVAVALASGRQSIRSRPRSFAARWRRVCYEMATHVSLTATTPILNQSNERNATILDGRGALAALSVGIPQFMLSSTLPVRFALEFFGADGLARRRRAGRQRSVPRWRPPARLQHLRPGLCRRRAGSDRVDPVSPRRHRRRHAGWLQRRCAGHLGRRGSFPGGQDLRPKASSARTSPTSCASTIARRPSSAICARRSAPPSSGWSG